jgi:predicted branched-subunit amino acid permease
MAPRWRGAPAWWRAVAAYLLVDPSLAVGLEGYERTAERTRGHDFYLGGAGLLWVAWLTAISVGAFAGAGLPAGLHLELVIPLFLAGEVAHRCTSTLTAVAVGTAALTALVCLHAPLHVGPLVAIGAGIAVGLGIEEAAR